LSPLSYGNKKSDELQQEMELKNNKNCYSPNEVDKINSNIDQVPNKSICNSNDLKFKNNNEATDLDNQYNVGNILNNYIKGKINSNDQLNSMKRSYNLGKNITSKWDLPKKVNNFKNKKGKENNAI
ncbi:hypothetical protein, partial [Clostridium tarantellae]|uniref:hypothetical protein n=1 Tax=Clostridium tarantellae TaxID=39493 RepID=UPI0014787510